ncbi:Corepressor interacting with RBPJ 1 [Strongyloides ratti]|uniref:Corepressor interacting with RBPJ 1 n=1 Tax=Strongyloides ratti TaxID=34506 RepID=A0A090MYL0_STRRB|nr:Corepressor interacting with RBPJ 1 [Strongyloides ratti]CEF67369.1 Corepressor interacting with RBPJ 1 [Strongyloides ratti]
MGKGFQNFMSKKDFHPSAIWNLKRKYEALEKQKMEEKRQAEMDELYKKEQEILEHKALLGDEKAKLGLSFMYDAPAGINKREEENKPEPKFEWQRKYNAPREAYARNNDQIVDQPFGIEVRHVRCVKCKKWGHLNTDSECPMFSKDDEFTSTNPSEIFKAGKANSSVATKQEPSVSKGQLIYEMKEEHGLLLKEKILSNIRTDECLTSLAMQINIKYFKKFLKKRQKKKRKKKGVKKKKSTNVNKLMSNVQKTISKKEAQRQAIDLSEALDGLSNLLFKLVERKRQLILEHDMLKEELVKKSSNKQNK